jgi:hypothetical protein
MSDQKKTSSKKARFINPPNRIKTKVGSGGLSENLIERAQYHIETAEVEYEPEAQKHLKEIGDVIARLKAEKGLHPVDPLINPVMQLKASGGMFRYQLVSDVADIALNFIESLKAVNEAALDVVQAHLHTIHIIMNHKLKGSGGKEGFALIKELDNACQRYYSKYEVDGTKKDK